MNLPYVTLSVKMRRLCLETGGASAVEFGLIVVPFLALLLSIFDTGFMYWSSEGLQVAVQDASRNLLTGTAQGASIATADQFRTTYLCPSTGTRLLPSFIDCSKLIIDVRSYARSYSTFSTLDTANDFYASGATRQFCPGHAGAITVVRVAYPMPVFLPTIVGTTNAMIRVLTVGLFSGVPGTTGYTHLLLGTAVFQTEPWNDASYTSPSGC